MNRPGRDYPAPFNISGHPGISCPAGVSREGMPIGMQLIGRRGSEYEQLAVGHAISSRLSLPPFPDPARVVAFVRGDGAAR